MLNAINQKAHQFKSIVTGYEVPTFDLNQETNLRYDGTFKTIYDMIVSDKIKLLTQGDQVVGISVNSGMDSVEMDNLAGKHFAEAYDQYTALNFVMTAMALKVSGAKVSKIVEDEDDVFIYLGEEGKIVDKYGDVVVALTNKEKQQVTIDDVCQLLDNRLQEYLEYLEEIEYKQDEDEEEHVEYHKEDLPDSIDITADQLGGYNRIEDYLRDCYQHYLARGNCIDVTYYNDVYHISNIKWGRKKR